MLGGTLSTWIGVVGAAGTTVVGAVCSTGAGRGADGVTGIGVATGAEEVVCIGVAGVNVTGAVFSIGAGRGVDGATGIGIAAGAEDIVSFGTAGEITST